jgi:hypothetical protein
MTDGEILFWTTSTVTTVDVTGITADGQPFFIESLTTNQHRVEIDTEQYTGMVFVVPFDFATTGSAAVHDTGFDLDTTNVVKDVQVHITTAGADTSDFFEFGTSTDVSGFIAMAKMSATGLRVKRWVTDLSIAVTATADVLYGFRFLVSTTAQNATAVHQIANATSGARLTYNDISGTAGTAAGYVYVHLDKLIVV